MKQKDYLTACELIKHNLKDEFSRLLRDEFVIPRYNPAVIHEYLFNLDLHIVLTQNFDKIYDTYASTESSNTIMITNYYDDDIASVVRGNCRAIIKAHGTIDQPTKMVFTRSEYGKARYDYSTFYLLLDSLVLTHTFVFVGCGLDDPDTRMTLERHAHLFPYGRPHFIVLPSGQHRDIQESTSRNLNLRMLTYKSDNNHIELSNSLKNLVDSVEIKRNEMASSFNW